MRILLADDDPLARKLVNETLSRAGYTVEQVENGAMAWEKLSKASHSIAILDWNMPGMDGLEICQRLQNETGDGMSVYVILLTARRDSHDISQGLAAGASDYLTKPFDTVELVARVQVGERLMRMREQLLTHSHNQKLESIGRLAAGIAHEINTPIQYIGDNNRFLRDAFTDISGLLESYRALVQRCQQVLSDSQELLAVLEATDQADLEFLSEEIPSAIEQSLDGIRRVSEIVSAMKQFSHPGTEERTPADVNQLISNAVAVSRNEWKYVAELETDLDPSVGMVPCFPGELSQVFLNLIVNAAHAIEERVDPGRGERGSIRIRSLRHEDRVEIALEDTGGGIPDTIRDKIFDPFFTTKEVGKGTGQGLAIARSVLLKHEGDLSFDSEMGVGTTFRLRLPLNISEEPETV
ncbi:MAG: response regulator [Planctomycetota bacterium]